MKAKSKQSSETSQAEAPLRASEWSLGKRRVVSLLVALHVVAIFSAPCAMPPPSSPLEQRVAGWFAPYLSATHMQSGYRFFAPNPGASNIIWYVAYLPDGTEHRGQFPDTEVHWPRLLYHRHFMISETINSLISPYGPSPAHLPLAFPDASMPEAQWKSIQADWTYRRSMVEPVLQAVAADLQQHHGALRVELILVEHRIPLAESVVEGMSITAEELYQPQPLGSYVAEDASWHWHHVEESIGYGALPTP